MYTRGARGGGPHRVDGAPGRYSPSSGAMMVRWISEVPE
jgi:hypothetical protein